MTKKKDWVETIKVWAFDQWEKAKAAWFTAVALSAMLGYNLSITPIEVDPEAPVVVPEVQVDVVKPEPKPEPKPVAPAIKAVQIKDVGTTVIINGESYSDGQVDGGKTKY